MVTYGIVILGIGLWLLQDGLASIVYYPTEKWLWNHMARAIRMSEAIVLIVIGVLLIKGIEL